MPRPPACQKQLFLRESVVELALFLRRQADVGEAVGFPAQGERASYPALSRPLWKLQLKKDGGSSLPERILGVANRQEPPMRDTTGKQNKKESVQALTVSLSAVVATSLQALVHTVSMHALDALLRAEQTALCGPRYQHDPPRSANRHGATVGELVLGGRRVRVSKPRVRSVDGQELHLPTWEQLSREDPLDARATEQMLFGVSTRKYARSLEPLPNDIDAFGTSKSAVSRRFVKQATAQVEEFLRRPLDSLRLCVLMLDGVHVAEHVLLVAVGIDEQGNKHVLGMRSAAVSCCVICTSAECRQSAVCS